jgi:hypothetical protein
MVRCSTPDTLIGLGAGGSRIVYRFMEQEWVLNEVLGRGPGGDYPPDTLRATTIDTATDEAWHDDRAAVVDRTVDTAIERSVYNQRDGYLEFEGPTIIPDELPAGWTDDLTEPDAIADLRSDVGLNSWWLKQGRDPLTAVDDGFGRGLYRRRAMGKALYHVSQEHDVDAEPVRIPVEGEVCLVTTLGGGTGSGIVTDLAADLVDRYPEVDSVHLYGVLPGSGEAADIKTNAYAALSELEYVELTGESPFDSITLLPHLDAVVDDDAAFELAAVRTILARQNGGEAVDELRPYRQNTLFAPGYAPFTIASPATLRYGFVTRRDARDTVMETLEEKRAELDTERALLGAVEQYLKQTFPESAGAELAGPASVGRVDFDDHDRRLLELRHRIEADLVNEFLGSDVLTLLDIETAERIDEAFREVSDEEHLGTDGVDDETKRARLFVERVPDRLVDRLESEVLFELTEQDQIAYLLASTVQQELENVAHRRDLYEAISRITIDEVSGLSETEAEVVRTTLVEVVLDDERRYPESVIANPRIRDLIEDAVRELDRCEEVAAVLETQYETIVRELRERGAEWRYEVKADAVRLAAINREWEVVADTLDDLSRRIEQRCRELNSVRDVDELERIELDLDQIGPLGPENLYGITPVNEKLGRMGLSRVPAIEIEEGFESAKRARELEMAHGRGLLFPSDNADEFAVAVQQASEDGWFSINPSASTTSIEDEFVCSFNAEKLRRDDEVESSESDAIESVGAAFVEAFTDDGTFVEGNPESEHGVHVPDGQPPQTVRATLESALAASTATDADALLGGVLPVDDVDPSEPSARPLSGQRPNGDAMEQLVDAYLRPIGRAYETATERAAELTGDGDSPGLLARLKTLRALTVGEHAVADDGHGSIELPEGTPGRDDPPSGVEFAQTYDGIYEFDFDDPFERDDPYVRPMWTAPDDLAGDPEHIGDTDLLENCRDEVEQEFRRETSDLIENDKRAPYELSLFGNAEKVDNPAYKQHRIRQVYLSRGLEEQYRVGKQYDDVYDEYRNAGLPLANNPELYDAETHPHGWADDVTMVTFVGGLFLDNINLVSEPGGYRDAYEETRKVSEFPGSHHTIGLGAMWDRWSVLGEWVTDAWEEVNPDSDADFGGFVSRDEVYDPTDQSFVDEVQYRNETDGESAVDQFLDALTADAYENTVEVE